MYILHAFLNNWVHCPNMYAMDWILVFPKNVYVEVLIPNATVFGGGPLGGN